MKSVAPRRRALETNSLARALWALAASAKMHIAATLPAMRVCHCFSSSSVAFADFDQSVQQINSFDQGSTRGVHTVREGETLQSIAAALWRDASATAVAFFA